MGSVITIPFVLAGITLAAALWVRFTRRAVLNIVDYSKVSDVRGLHRWAGNRLLLLPAVSAAMGLAIMTRPHLALPMLFANIAAILGVVGWLIVGSRKFTADKPVGAANAK